MQAFDMLHQGAGDGTGPLTAGVGRTELENMFHKGFTYFQTDVGTGIKSRQFTPPPECSPQCDDADECHRKRPQNTPGHIHDHGTMDNVGQQAGLDDEQYPAAKPQAD